MIIVDVAAVTLAAVLANHMGLIEAIERVVRHKLPIINCSRCLTFWSVLICLVCCRSTATIFDLQFSQPSLGLVLLPASLIALIGT